MQLDARILGGELPLRRFPAAVSALRPGRHLPLDGVRVLQAAVQALAVQHAELAFRHVQPAAAPACAGACAPPRAPCSPDWSAYLSAQANHRLDNGGSLFSQLDVLWRGDVVGGADNDPNKDADAHTTMNLRVGYRTADERYEVTLWGKNLTDEHYHTGGFNGVVRSSSIGAFHAAEPRNCGITLRARM